MAQTLDFGLPDGGTTDLYGIANMTSGALPSGPGAYTMNQPSSSFNAMSLVPALTTLLGVSANVADIRNRSRAIINNIGAEVETFRWSQNIRKQQLQELNRAVGDKMTERGVQAMETEARLRAAAAETGTAGGTTAIAVQDAYMKEALDMAAIARQGEVSKVSMFRQLQAERMSMSNRIQSLASGLQSPLSAGLSTLNVAATSFNAGVGYLNTSQQESLFNISEGTRTP